MTALANRKAWREYYGPDRVRTYEDIRAAGSTYTSGRYTFPTLSSLVLAASEGDAAGWAVDAHAYKCKLPLA